MNSIFFIFVLDQSYPRFDDARTVAKVQKHFAANTDSQHSHILRGPN